MRCTNILVIGLLSASFAGAQSCTIADVRGTYQFKTWGWQNLGPNHPALPNAMGPTYGLGVVTLDGAGKGSGRYTATLGGVSQVVEFSDFEYKVDNNCGGAATYRMKAVESASVQGPDAMSLQVLRDGAEILGMTTESPGRDAIMRSEFRRLSRSPRACHQSTLRGSYAMHYEGWVNMQMFGPSQPAYFAPEIGAGQLAIDSNGVSGNAIHNWGGIRVATDFVSGGFIVNEDCTATFDYVSQVRGSQNRMTGKWPAVVSSDGSEATVLGLNPPAFQIYERVSVP